MEDISIIFRTALNHFFENGKWGIKTEIAKRSGLIPVQVSDILSGKVYGSEEQRRAIASACGYPGRAYEDFLDIGRDLMIKEDFAGYGFQKPKEVVDIMTLGLTPEQTEVVQMFRDLLTVGGEGVETLSDSIKSLASKKLPR